MQYFLDFVDVNCQSNVRSANSSGPTYYLLPKFTTLQTPTANCPQFQERLSRSVVGEFNRAQRETGRRECSNGSCHNWLKNIGQSTAYVRTKKTTVILVLKSMQR